MSNQHEDATNRKINEALRRGRGFTPMAPISESRQRINDLIRRQAKRGTWEVSAETGKIIARDGRPVEGK